MPAAPVYPSECARAASTAESRFRIKTPIAPARAARIVALDERAAGVMRRLAASPWANAEFYTGGGTSPDGGLLLHGLDGSPVPLGDVLTGSDVVVVLATEDGGRNAAAAIGRACGARAVTTAGVVLGDGFEADDAVAALRPYARVLLLSADESDVSELLTALRV
ncbi:3-methyl-2-oxobutanoate hydroxymethyltransferase [Streptomyces sp. 061-3]|uniref:3-methyl-2-oxobutanoate hydroxymethyltransferase n=1 Tax=Streptomyces sp. 061-3 TaxID=2789268 RepID=UPI003980E771